MLNKRIKIVRRTTQAVAARATDTGGVKYEELGTFWASETWSKGVKALHEGAMDAYDTVMFRMRYNKDVDRWCLIQYHGKWYQIQSLNEDYHDNQLQITAIEMPNQKVNIIEPTPEQTPSSVHDGSAVNETTIMYNNK